MRQTTAFSDTTRLTDRQTLQQLTEEVGHQLEHRVKPVLNWANVCSPNILRTVRRTMIHFLTELLVRRTWFGPVSYTHLRAHET